MEVPAMYALTDQICLVRFDPALCAVTIIGF